MNEKTKNGLFVLITMIPLIGGLVYSRVKNKNLEKQNKKLTIENERTKARNNVLEGQNEQLMKELDKLCSEDKA